MTYQTTARCPVCKAVFDTIQHPHPEMDGMGGAMLLGECRSEHADASPACVNNAAWIEGWILDEPVYVDGPKLGDSRRDGGDIYVYGMNGWHLFSSGNLSHKVIEQGAVGSVDVVSQGADQPRLAVRGTTTEPEPYGLFGHKGSESFDAGCLFRGPDGEIHEIPPRYSKQTLNELRAKLAEHGVQTCDPTEGAHRLTVKAATAAAQRLLDRVEGRYDYSKDPKPAIALWRGRYFFDRHELIATTAYHLYEKRGRIDGHADQDWFEAERFLDGPEPNTES